MSFSANLDISSANASAVLIVDDIFPAGVILQMFSTDQALKMDTIILAETHKGVDGKLVAGFLPNLYPVTITLEAASPSHASLATLWQAMTVNQRLYTCHLVCTLPSIKSVFTWSTGVMKSGTPFPEMKKVLSPTTWTFNFQDFVQATI